MHISSFMKSFPISEKDTSYIGILFIHQCTLACHIASLDHLDPFFGRGTVSVLWREEEYTVKYSLNTREIPRAEPKGFPEGSGYISPYIPTWVKIQTFSISKSYTSSIVLPGRAILEELILCIGLDPVHPVENSVVAALGNIHGQESITRRVKFQYHPF